MAINGISSDINYYRFMSKISNSDLSSSAISNVKKLVSSQLSNTSALEQVLQNRYSTMQNNMQRFASYQKEAKSFYSDFGSNASSLKGSASQLTSVTKGTNSSMGFGSTNSAVASITGGGMVGTGKLDVSVGQIASAQKSTSSALTSNQGYNLGGKSEMTIVSQGKSTSLSFNISNSSTNKSALTEIAGQINSSKLGVTASVETKNGVSSLAITSNETGADNGFTVSTTGNLDKLRLQTDTAAQDAKYSVNGTDFTSSKNDVKLGDTGLTARLSGAGKTTVERGVQDRGKTLDATKNFVTDYNDMVGFLSDNSSKSSTIKDLAYSYASTRFEATALGKIGITTKSNGSMSIDENKFNAALAENPDKVNQTLARLAESTSSKTQNAVSNATKLYDAPKMDSSQGFGGVYNSYSQFVQNPNVAMNMLDLLR